MADDVAVHDRAGPGGGDQVAGVALTWTPTQADLPVALREAQRGSEDAFRVLYRAIQPGLLRYLQVLVGQDAEDVASEAWLQITRDLASFRGEVDGFRGWATTIARHRALDHLRRQRKRPTVVGPVEQLAELPGHTDTADSAVDAVTTRDALALIARLPRDQAEAVLLRVVVGLDAATAARVLGKRPGAVRTAAHRGLRRLAEYLDPSDSTAPGQPGAAGSQRRNSTVRRPE